jgi:uncharacterized Zn finger protein
MKEKNECRSCGGPLEVLPTEKSRQKVKCKHCGDIYYQDIPKQQSDDEIAQARQLREKQEPNLQLKQARRLMSFSNGKRTYSS